MALTLTSRRKAIQGMSLTPLIDIVFQLLIFFLLTANYLNLRVMELGLPGAAASARGFEHQILYVGVEPGNRTTIDDAPVAVDALPGEIRERTKGDPTAIVLIDAHEEAEVELLVRVMDEIERAGIKNVQMLDDAARQRLGRKPRGGKL